MKHRTDTLLPLGEKGRDEGLATQGAVPMRKDGVGATRCVAEVHSLRSKSLLEQPLTPAPLPQGERGVA